MNIINEKMNIVIVGHVDHGKSTVIGRLLADTGSLPDGKLEQVKRYCERNSRPFEYAYLLDALKDEQSQGITIDMARCFFQTAKRQYIIIDAPGHVEFLKNMVTGASRAEAALLVIDAHEGVQENSRRHGFLMKLLGINQVAVAVNKMDLVDYSEDVFNRVTAEYSDFLNKINVTPVSFIPLSARDGQGVVTTSHLMPWYKGGTVIDIIDSFIKTSPVENLPLRLPVQDIYKFTEHGDDRRIFAGTVEIGSLRPGDSVVFHPSLKESAIKSIEGFNEDLRLEVSAGKSTGVTLQKEIYVKPGEIIAKKGEIQPKSGTTFRAAIFWVGKKPMISGKRYKIKIAADRAPVYLKNIEHIIDASTLTTEGNKETIERHDVAEAVFETTRPVAFDLAGEFNTTSRFVIVDDYEITGGGIILEDIKTESSLFDEHISKREKSWIRSSITGPERTGRFEQKAALVILTGSDSGVLQNNAAALERNLHDQGRLVYYLGLANIKSGLDSDVSGLLDDRDEHIRRLGEIAHIFTDAGQILITTIPELAPYEAEILKTLTSPADLILVTIGETALDEDSVTLRIDSISESHIILDDLKTLLKEQMVLPEYYL